MNLVFWCMSNQVNVINVFVDVNILRLYQRTHYSVNGKNAASKLNYVIKSQRSVHADVLVRTFLGECFIKLVDLQSLGACPEMCWQNERCWLAKKNSPAFLLIEAVSYKPFVRPLITAGKHEVRQLTESFHRFLFFSVFASIKRKRSVWEGEWTQQLSGSVWKRDKQHEGTADELIESRMAMRRGIAAAIIPTALFLFCFSNKKLFFSIRFLSPLNPHSREKAIFAQKKVFWASIVWHCDFFLKEVASNFSLAWVSGGWWKSTNRISDISCPVIWTVQHNSFSSCR